MTVNEAYKIIRNYYYISNPAEDDTFLYTEALDYLIKEKKDPDAMMELGGMYYAERQFDLALKYYEMAAEYGSRDAMTCLGYIWYYGRTGKVDYEKAFGYYSRAMKKGDRVAEYKVADMYRNGYFVEKDPDRYRSMIEALYKKVQKDRRPNGIAPEIFTRLAKIRSGEGKTEEALELYDAARVILSRRIQANPFFGNLNIMKWMIDDIYELREFDEYSFGLYDLYWLLQKPVKVRFLYEDEVHEVEAVQEEELVIRFDDKWFRNADEFFKNAELDGEALTALYEELYEFEVV